MNTARLAGVSSIAIDADPNAESVLRRLRRRAAGCRAGSHPGQSGTRASAAIVERHDVTDRVVQSSTVSHMIVRPAKPDDAREIAEIHVRTWQAAYPGIVPAEYLASLRVERYESMWKEKLPRDRPVARCGRGRSHARLGGFGASRDNGAASSDAEIWAIYVSPSQWSKGVGRMLWSHAHARLRALGFTFRRPLGFPGERTRREVLSWDRVRNQKNRPRKSSPLRGVSLNEIHYVRPIDARPDGVK